LALTIGDPPYRRFRRRQIDPQRAPEQSFAVEITEHDIGVANRRLYAAAAIGSRSRLRTRAPWADL